MATAWPSWRSCTPRYGHSAGSKVLKKLLPPGLDKPWCSCTSRCWARRQTLERGNRRYRNMQKTVYPVRTQRHPGHLAPDLLRDSTPKAGLTLPILHKATAA